MIINITFTITLIRELFVDIISFAWRSTRGPSPPRGPPVSTVARVGGCARTPPFLHRLFDVCLSSGPRERKQQQSWRRCFDYQPLCLFCCLCVGSRGHCVALSCGPSCLLAAPVLHRKEHKIYIHINTTIYIWILYMWRTPVSGGQRNLHLQLVCISGIIIIIIIIIYSLLLLLFLGTRGWLLVIIILLFLGRPPHHRIFPSWLLFSGFIIISGRYLWCVCWAWVNFPDMNFFPLALRFFFFSFSSFLWCIRKEFD